MSPLIETHMSQFKVVLLGEGRVGKTCIVLKYVKDQFNEKEKTTVQASFLRKTITIDDTPYTLALWDTAGQERFHALGPIYYRDANGAILVYDITDMESFNRVKKWVKELHKMAGENINIVLCGNKADLEKSRVVPVQEAQSYADSVGAKHFSVSAKTGRNLHEMFLSLTQDMVRAQSRLSTPFRSSTGSESSGLRIASSSSSSSSSRKEGGCC